VWQIVYLTILGFVTLIIPFAVFHYDAYDIDSKTAKMVGGGVRQCCRAIRWQFVSLVLATCFLIPMYVLLNKTSIPFTNIQVNVSQISAAGPVPVFGGAACVGGVACVEEKRKLAMQVTFPVYVMAMMSWVGWFFFVVFGGIGLASLPGELIRNYVDRPVIFIFEGTFGTLGTPSREPLGPCANPRDPTRLQPFQLIHRNPRLPVARRSSRARRSCW